VPLWSKWIGTTDPIDSGNMSHYLEVVTEADAAAIQEVYQRDDELRLRG
jgi:hypothetical protein